MRRGALGLVLLRGMLFSRDPQSCATGMRADSSAGITMCRFQIRLRYTASHIASRHCAAVQIVVTSRQKKNVLSSVAVG
jgi:hypothetical protein